MKALQFSDFVDGDAWLVLRLDAQVAHQSVDVYLMMEFPSSALIGFQTIDSAMAEERHVSALMVGSYAGKKLPGRPIPTVIARLGPT